MINNGATSLDFIDTNYTKTRYLNLKKLDRLRDLRDFDGKPSIYGNITHYIFVKLRIGEYLKHVRLFITPLKQYEMIFGYE